MYNVTARSSGPSLKDRLYTGPKLRMSLSDMLLCFLLQRIALTGDIEKVFMMVAGQEKFSYSLCLPWVADPTDESSNMITLLFVRVVFGISFHYC